MERRYGGLLQNYWQESGPYHLDDESIPKEQLCSINYNHCDLSKDTLFEKDLIKPPFSDMNENLYSHIDDLMKPQNQEIHQSDLTKLAKS